MTATKDSASNIPGALSDAQGHRLVRLLNERAADLKCEVCGNVEFDLNPQLGSPSFMRLTEDEKVNLDLTSAHLCAIAHCMRCGNTKFFSLSFLGFDPFEANPE